MRVWKINPKHANNKNPAGVALTEDEKASRAIIVAINRRVAARAEAMEQKISRFWLQPCREGGR